MAALGAEVGVRNGRAILAGVETASECWIGAEFGRAAVELASMTENHAGSAVHGAHNSAYLDIQVTILFKLADRVAVFPKTDDGEPARVVGGLLRTDVEKARSVWKLHYIIDMR